MDISIIVINYNGGELIKKCLASVISQRTTLSYEIIVVDNASVDGSREEILSRFPQVKLMANKTNLGFSRANNQAISLSRGFYLLLLNNDACIQGEDFLEKAVSFMEKKKDAGAMGPEMVSQEGKVQNPYYRGYPHLATEFLSLAGLLPLYNFFHRYGYFYTRDGLAFYRPGREPLVVFHLCGACMLFRRQALEEAGLLDEDMFFYREDMDICFRLRKKGWKIFILPYLKTIHVAAGSWEKAAFSVGREATRSLYVFFRKHYGSAAYQMLRLIHLAVVFPRILIYAFLAFLGKTRSKAKAYYQDILKASLIGSKR